MIEKLDKLFSEYVRKRSVKDGCITCGGKLTVKEATCGHFRKRRHMATRWHPLNGWAQCWECNSEDDESRMEKVLRRKIGDAQVDELIWLSHQEVRYTKSELNDIRLLLKQMIREL